MGPKTPAKHPPPPPAAEIYTEDVTIRRITKWALTEDRFKEIFGFGPNSEYVQPGDLEWKMHQGSKYVLIKPFACEMPRDAIMMVVDEVIKKVRLPEGHLKLKVT